MASHMRLTSRLRPSPMVISRIERSLEESIRPRRNGPGGPVVQFNTRDQPPDLCSRWHPVDQDGVRLGDSMARMGDQIRQITIVREHEEAFGIGVEAPNRVHPGIRRDDVGHRRPPVRVGRGTDHADRLVDQVVDEARSNRERHAVHLDAYLFPLDFLPKVGRFSVDGDPAGLDHFLRSAPRRDTGVGNQLLQTGRFGHASARNVSSRVSTMVAGGTWSASGGRSSIDRRPSFSRNKLVVP